MSGRNKKVFLFFYPFLVEQTRVHEPPFLYNSVKIYSIAQKPEQKMQFGSFEKVFIRFKRPHICSNIMSPANIS